ncbi:MAG: type II toxin-antitoxin system prevent-host-death family antitoxin [Deltaproteobacteria bacterium]|nr:type II toxin-antitoxin system prevent-host-death family antitoxin [Deltaproteobacteria bacterium]
MTWKLADAKMKFSEVVRRALTEGPQRVERRNDAVYVLSQEEYERLTGQKPSMVEFLLQGPDWSELDLERQQDAMRDFEL